MALRETYDVCDQNGVIREYPIGMAPVKARTKMLNADGSEIHSGHIIVNPLNRQPALKDMVEQLKRSGELGMRIRAAENLARAEDGDPTFEGYSRDWLEENWLSQQEADFIYDQLPPPVAPDEPSPVSATPVASPVAQAPAAPPEGAAQGPQTATGA